MEQKIARIDFNFGEENVFYIGKEIGYFKGEKVTIKQIQDNSICPDFGVFHIILNNGQIYKEICSRNYSITYFLEGQIS